MTRKKFIKNCMSVGINRNAANYMAKSRNAAVLKMAGRAITTLQITNCTETKDGAHFKLKWKKAGVEND